MEMRILIKDYPKTQYVLIIIGKTVFTYKIKNNKKDLVNTAQIKLNEIDEYINGRIYHGYIETCNPLNEFNRINNIK